MTATVISHPRRVRGAFRMASDVMSPHFHDGLRALRDLAGDPECVEFHRKDAARRVAEIEAITAGRIYAPPKEPA